MFVMNREAAAYDFLDRVGYLKKRPYFTPTNRKIPFITLTYAQSIDGFIAGKEGTPVQLSCQESLILTHALRATHDAILVGVQTVINDNPSLSTRLVSAGPPPECANPPSQPRPVVLDSTLRCPLNARVVREGTLIVCCKPDPKNSGQMQQFEIRSKELQQRGAQVLPVCANMWGQVDIHHALIVLFQEHNIISVMVEGGSRIIREFLLNQFVHADQLIITIAPKFLCDGVHLIPPETVPKNVDDQIHSGKDSQSKYTPERERICRPSLSDVTYQQFGADMVIYSPYCKQYL